MKKETNFNYGLLFVGLALPNIAEYFLGRATGVVVAIVVVVIGVILLASGHTHKEEGISVPRKRKLAAFVVIGASLSLAVMGMRAVYAREYAPHYVAPSTAPGAVGTSAAQNNNPPPSVPSAAQAQPAGVLSSDKAAPSKLKKANHRRAQSVAKSSDTQDKTLPTPAQQQSSVGDNAG